MGTSSIYINDYISFNTDTGQFEVSNKCSEILYREKGLICSYSGCIEWGHKFFCELLDLYSGNSVYNYSLGSVKHCEELAELYRSSHKGEVIDWIKTQKDKAWVVKAAAQFADIVDGAPDMTC